MEKELALQSAQDPTEPVKEPSAVEPVQASTWLPSPTDRLVA
jgi:hypothetical protein